MSNTEKSFAIKVANKKHLITTREAALLMGVNEDTVRRYIIKGYIKEGIVATRIGKEYRILRKEFMELILLGIGDRVNPTCSSWGQKKK